MNRQEREEFWRKRLMDAKQSGLTVKDWCKSNHVERRIYYIWKRRLLPVQASPGASPTQWLPVSVQEPDASSESPLLTIRIAGAEIDVHSGFNAKLLRSVIQALGSQGC